MNASLGISRKQQERSERGKAFREWLTIGLVLVTAAFVFFQLREMQKAYWPILDQAKATREAFTSVERAFVSDVRLEIAPIADTSKPMFFDLRLTVTNSGGTPTKSLRYVSGYLPWPSRVGDPASVIDAEMFPMSRLKGTLMIGPGGSAEIPLPGVPLAGSHGEHPDDAVADAIAGPIGSLYGAIIYRDRFPGSGEHVTKWCYVIVTSRTWMRGVPCPYWNCSDDDCKSEKKALEAERKNPPKWPPPGLKVRPAE